MDAGGNVYVTNDSNGLIVKETLSAGSYSPTTIVSGLSSPAGVAVDGSGNVYIADTDNRRVLKETLSGGTLHADHSTFGWVSRAHRYCGGWRR